MGLRVHGIVTANAHGPGAVVDVLAARMHARGGMARRAPRLVVATERGVSSAGAVVPLSDGAVLAVLGAEPTGILPEAARTVVREKRARVLPIALGDGASATPIAAACAGAALAVASRVLRAPVDGAAVARVVNESLGGQAPDAITDLARRAFEATRDVLAANA